MALFATFKIGFTKEQHRLFEIARECIEDDRRTSFYRSIGVDVEASIAEAIDIVRKLYKLN